MPTAPEILEHKISPIPADRKSRLLIPLCCNAETSPQKPPRYRLGTHFTVRHVTTKSGEERLVESHACEEHCPVCASTPDIEG